MTRIANKTVRLQEIVMLLMTHPEGMNQSEIAARLGVNRSTISRNLRDVQAPLYEEHGRLYLDRNADLLNLQLNLHEALSLHLAARLLAANMDRQNGHAASALRKISQAMRQLAPRLSGYIATSAEIIDELAGHETPTYMRVLETLTEGWTTGRKVQVWRRRSTAETLNAYLFSPYYIEPGIWGRATYVIGLREPPGQMRTLKIERIEAAELTKETYEIPPGFDPFQLLADAWGIWYTEEPPVEVALKFSPRVAARVLETRWHRSQQFEPCPDGSLIWRARVAAVQEMIPWVRGWGAEVQVLEPEELKNALKDEARRLAQLYKVDEKEE